MQGLAHHAKEAGLCPVDAGEGGESFLAFHFREVTW